MRRSNARWCWCSTISTRSASPSCLDVLAALFDYVPAGSQIAVASREAPALPVGRWRAQGRVQEFGVADLRLDEREAGLLLEAAGVELDERAVSELTERTEGWPAGLYLAALSFRAGAPRVAGAEGFAGDDRYVAEYFRFELLSRLPASEAEFLMRTSVLDRMCGPLCDAVLQTTGSADTLETLARSNGFVVPLDRRGEWYRYHHLFGELLRNELERSRPDVVPTLNRRAMDWCIANEFTEAAVVYGHAAGETDTVAGLVDALALPLYYDGRMETLEEWLAWFGDDELARYPALAVFGSLDPRPHGAACRGRAVACARRRSNLGDPALGWQRHDRAMDRHPAGAHDARRCRAGARRRRSGAGSALRREWLEADRARCFEALRTRCSARPIARRATSPQPSRKGWPRAPRKRSTADGAMLALLAAKRGAWAEARQRAQAAQAPVEEAGLGDYGTSAIALRGDGARRAPRGETGGCARGAGTRAPSAAAARPRPSVDDRPRRARAHTRPSRARRSERRPHDPHGDRAGARAPSADGVVGRRSATSCATVSRRATGPSGAWAMSLTGAELRLLPYLASHLTFPEIAGRLFISRNTAKTEAVAIYRKFGVSSRSEAIERAVEVGLLESSVLPPRANLTQDG